MNDLEAEGARDPMDVPEGVKPTIEGGNQSGVSDRHSDIFFAAVETTRMPMVVTDPFLPDNPIIFANNAFIQMTGYAREEIVGRNCRFLQGPDTDPDTVQQVRDALRDRRELSTEILNYRRNGSTFWNALYISPVLDQRGALRYFFASQLDVSRRRDAEESLRQAQKMESLGQLTGGIAHDFNNLLQVMSGYLELMQGAVESGAPDPRRLAKHLGAVRGAARRAATLTQQLLAFSRKQRLEGRAINLNDLVADMEDIARRTLGDETALVLDLAEGLPNCRLDATQAEVALLNVLVNARDALDGREPREVTVSTREVSLAEDDPVSAGRVTAGDYVQLSVSDTGGGIPAEVLPRVMEPFFTTKEEGRGTGLGLAMVYGFARQSGGLARVESRAGEGTTVHLLFPVRRGEEGAPARRPPRAIERPGNETILVVDDRPEVAELAQAILEEFGYTVHLAHGGPEAMELIRGGLALDMIFTDVIMPGGMNGVTLAREARRHRPRIKVLLTTGYASGTLNRAEGGSTEFEMIQKPYGRADLARKVRIVLDGPTGTG